MTPQLREARIDLGAIKHNLAVLGSDHRVDLSGDAFGHGASLVARAALDAGATNFIVSDSDVETTVREAARTRPIRIVSGMTSDAAACLYGVGGATGFRPVMRVTARVISVKRLAEGQPVSYGYTWRAPRDTTLALTAIGYADGISRRASNLGTAFLRGERAIVGRIAMDVLSLDFGDDVVEVGDEVTLFGHEPGSTDSWARVLGVSPLSVTANIGHRVPRVPYEGQS